MLLYSQLSSDIKPQNKIQRGSLTHEGASFRTKLGELSGHVLTVKEAGDYCEFTRAISVN